VLSAANRGKCKQRPVSVAALAACLRGTQRPCPRLRLFRMEPQAAQSLRHLGLPGRDQAQLRMAS